MAFEISYKKLSEVADVVDSLHQTPEYVEQGLPMVRVTDVKPGALSLDGCVRVSKEVFDIFTRKHVPSKGDIVISRVGTYGVFSYVSTDERFCLGQNTAIVVPKIDSRYLYYMLISSETRKQIEKMVVGSTQKTISLKNINNLQIPIFDQQLQDKISFILGRIDEKIECNMAINDLLYKECMLVYEKETVGSKLGRLGDLLDIIESGSRQRGGAITSGVVSIGAENIERIGVYDYSKEKYISEEYFYGLKRGVVESGDVLLYKDGAYTGKASMALDGFPYERCAVNEHVFILRTPGRLFQNYLYFTLSQEDVRSKIFAMASSKAAQPGLNKSELQSVEVLMPPEEAMQNFEHLVSPLTRKIISNSKESKKLLELRDLILPRIIDGTLALN